MYKSSHFGWIVATIIIIILAAVIINSNNKKPQSTTTYQTVEIKPATTNYTMPKYTTTTTAPEAKTETVTWHCVDATSYNKNAYDDNKCTSSTGEVRYVSDSQSRALDPSYTPGTSGHPYYNSK